MRRHLSRLLILFALLIGALPAHAEANHIRAELVAESASPLEGSTISLALSMIPEPNWHGYWKNPGDAGIGMRFDWKLPKGMTVGDPAYPVPETLLVAGLMNHVYKGPYALLMPLKIPADLAPGTVLPIRAKVDWLACSDTLCVPEKADVSIDLTIGDGAISAVDRQHFDTWQAALPRPLNAAARFALEGGRLRIAVPLPAAVNPSDPHFFADANGAVDYPSPQSFFRSGDLLIIETAAQKDARLDSLPGLLRLGPDKGLQFTATAGSVPSGGQPLKGKASDEGGIGVVLAALGAAILGGLILNIMPCVFPILSLKALELARAGGDERAARRDALAYTAGVITVCVGLGAMLIALRAGGLTLGWAFQLQDTRVIFLLALLVTAVALNLTGLFELSTVSFGKTGAPLGSFSTGALAAFVATPCTGPFMGVALGAALVLPVPAALAIFAGLGLGLALPFLALGLIPRLRKMLPKPGAWMQRLRHILSLPMLATLVGLLWILGRQGGVDAMTLGIIGVVLLALALWWLGSRQRAGRGGALAAFVMVLAAAVGLAAVLPTDRPASTQTAEQSGAITFSEERLAALRTEGRPVFVYFTADWCITCKVNERTAIDRDEVKRAFRDNDVAVLVGDWTDGNAAISRFLSANGRSGVPLYLYYRPGGQSPEVLPQVLTPGLLTALVP